MESKSKQKLILTCAKVVISLLSFGYIYFTFSASPNFYLEFFENWQSFSLTENASSLWIALLLVPINWGIEAHKWQFLAHRIENLSIWQAYKGVLAGLTLGFVTPHAIGDYAARIYFMQIKHRLRAIGAILIARLSLFFITLFYGFIGFIILYTFTGISSGFFNMEVLFLTFLFFIVLYLAILNYASISKFLIAIPLYRKYIHPYFKIITYYKTYDFYYCLSLSLIRYLLFTVQYLLLLNFFGINPFNILVISAIWLIFLAKSVFPSFNFLNDVGVREAAALFFLGHLGIDNMLIVTVSLSVWFMNIFIPTLVGLFIIIFSGNTITQEPSGQFING